MALVIVGLIINGALTIITAIAAIIAWRQRQDAVAARDDAREAADAAKKSAEALDRSADAQERLAKVAEAGQAKPPWKFEKVSGHRWKVTNQTGMNVDYVKIESRPEGFLQVEMTPPSHFDVAKDESFHFGFGGAVTDPASVNVTIEWRDPVTKMQKSAARTIP
jgi:hypothetical protein